MPKRQEDIYRRIKTLYPDLPKAEKRLADLIHGFHGNLASYSATELATMTGISQATVTRFIRRLGFDSFYSFRETVRQARLWGSPLYHEEGEGSAVSAIVQAHFAHEIQNMEALRNNLSQERLESALQLIQQAPRVWVYGYRNSYPLAMYLQRQLTRLRPLVTLHPLSGQTSAEDLIDLKEGTLLILIAFRRRPPIIEKLIKLAQKNNASCLMIADHSALPLGTEVSELITCSTESGTRFDTYAGAISLLNLLCSAFSEMDMDYSFARLRQMEDTLEELDEL